jgi:hypothetical protein
LQPFRFCSACAVGGQLIQTTLSLTVCGALLFLVCVVCRPVLSVCEEL